MGTKQATYNFHTQSGQAALAARIASLKTTHIQELIKLVFGTTVNVMQKFPNPPKCNAAIYIVDNAPQMVLQQIIAQYLPTWEKEVRDSGNKPGRDVNVYKHDPDKNNNAMPPREHEMKIQVEDVGEIVRNEVKPSPMHIDYTPGPVVPKAKQVDENGDEVEEDIEKLNDIMREILLKGKAGKSMDEDRVREIARDEDMKLGAFVKDAISKAMANVFAPTIIHVAYTEADKSVSIKDMGLQHKRFPELHKYVMCRYPVFLPGPAGSGKTTAAMNIAKLLSLKFYHNGAVDTEYKLLGFENAMGKFTETQFYLAYKFGGIYLFDEVDASNPQALVALNAALENGKCVFGNGECVDMHADFRVIAAANTYGQGATHEYVGRNKLDAATIDRFIMLDWPYDEALERAIALSEWDGAGAWVDTVQRYRRAVKNASGIKHVISPRASIRGARMLKAGVDEAMVLDAVVWKGLPSEQIATLKRAA